MCTAVDIASVEADLARVRAIARRFAQDVREHFGGRTRRIVLFGSGARGDWTEDSDIDVLVLLDELSLADKNWLSRRACQSGLMENDVLLQPIYMPEERFLDLQDRERRLALDIQREGLEL